MAVLRPGHDVRDFGGRRDQVQDGSRWRRSPRTARSSSCGASRGRYSVHEPSQFLTADTGLTATTSGSSRAVAALAEPLDDRGGAGAEQRSCCRGCNGHCRILDGKFIRHQGCCSCAAGTQQSCRGATGDPRSPLERAVRIRAVEGHGDSLLVARAGAGRGAPWLWADTNQVRARPTKTATPRAPIAPSYTHHSSGSGAKSLSQAMDATSRPVRTGRRPCPKWPPTAPSASAAGVAISARLHAPVRSSVSSALSVDARRVCCTADLRGERRDFCGRKVMGASAVADAPPLRREACV